MSSNSFKWLWFYFSYRYLSPVLDHDELLCNLEDNDNTDLDTSCDSSNFSIEQVWDIIKLYFLNFYDEDQSECVCYREKDDKLW